MKRASSPLNDHDQLQINHSIPTSPLISLNTPLPHTTVREEA
jgi:hypothetical protein